MSKYMRLIGQNARKASLDKINSKTKNKILKRYKVWAKKKFMGREFMGILRTNFLNDTNGKFVKIWDNVKVKDHAKEVLETLKTI